MKATDSAAAPSPSRDADEGEEVPLESPEIGKIQPKNSPLWKTDPDQQLGYYTIRAWARRHRPDVLLGVYDREEAATMSREDGAATSFEQLEARALDGQVDQSAPEPVRSASKNTPGKASSAASAKDKSSPPGGPQANQDQPAQVAGEPAGPEAEHAKSEGEPAGTQAGSRKRSTRTNPTPVPCRCPSCGGTPGFVGLCHGCVWRFSGGDLWPEGAPTPSPPLARRLSPAPAPRCRRLARRCRARATGSPTRR